MVAIIDDREDVWSRCPNLIHVKPYVFFAGTADINAPSTRPPAPPTSTIDSSTPDSMPFKVRHMTSSRNNNIIPPTTMASRHHTSVTEPESSPQTKEDNIAEVKTVDVHILASTTTDQLTTDTTHSTCTLMETTVQETVTQTDTECDQSVRNEGDEAKLEVHVPSDYPLGDSDCLDIDVDAATSLLPSDAIAKSNNNNNTNNNNNGDDPKNTSSSPNEVESSSSSSSSSSSDEEDGGDGGDGGESSSSSGSSGIDDNLFDTLGEKTESLTADMNDSEGGAVVVGPDSGRVGDTVNVAQTEKDEVSMEETVQEGINVVKGEVVCSPTSGEEESIEKPGDDLAIDNQGKDIDAHGEWYENW